jgi:sugar transferase (PEP-CTERM system associated)
VPLLILIALESVVFFSALFVASSLSSSHLLDALSTNVLSTIVTVVMLLSYFSMGLYHFHLRARVNEIIVRIIVGLFLGSVALAALFYVIPNLRVPHGILDVALLYGFSATLLIRVAFLQVVDESFFRRKTLIYGAGEKARSILDLRRKADRRGFKIVGTVPAAGDTIIEALPNMVSEKATLAEVVKATGAEEIVVVMDDRRGFLPERELLDCKLRGIEVIGLLEFLERETGKIHVDLARPSWLIFSPGFRLNRVRKVVKRVVDLLLAAILIVVASPVMVFAAIAIKCEEGLRAPVFYLQERIGLRGDPFHLIKFRSMREDAEEDGQKKWAEADDPRVTRVGRIMRDFRIDELPQLFNVMMGQMSVVGPRPERSIFVDDLAAALPFYPERHAVKPGITGWAQVRYSYAASEVDAQEKLCYDLYYVKNHSLLLDIIIILQTVEVVLWSKGAR